MHWRTARNLAALLICAGALTACGKQPTAPAQIEPPLDMIPAISSAAAVVLPMDAYGLSVDQQALDYRARDLLIRDCIKAAGAEWAGSTAEQEKSIDRYQAGARKARFGLVEENEAAKYGYQGSPELASPEPVTDQTPSFVACSKEAKVKLGAEAPPAAEFFISMKIPQDAAARVVNDSRYVTMLGKWADCMAKAGHKFSSPQDAAKDTRWPDDHPTEPEIAAAVQDVRCKKQAGYLDLVVALRIAYEKQLIEENSAVMQRLSTYYEGRGKRVTDLLSGKVE